MKPEHDEALDDLAKRQHGVVTRKQALDLGLSASSIQTRLENGRLQQFTRGVYVLRGREVNNMSMAMAATLAIPDAVASHETAAELHGFSYVPRGRAVVTAPNGANHRSPLARVHEYQGIDCTDHTQVDHIPVTTRELTIFHLAAVLPPLRLGRVLDDQLNAGLVDIEQMFALADFWTRKGRKHSRSTRALLLARGPGFVAPESALESAFLELITRFQLPTPAAQFPTPWDPDEGRIDFAYPNLKILIELDGRRWHGRDAANANDRARDRKAQLSGWIILRWSWHEVTRLPEIVAMELRNHIEARACA